MKAVDYNWVAQFVSVARVGSFTAAAEELRVPKSSISRSITSLERRLGVQLLHRTSRKFALTEAGQAYFESIRAAFDTVNEATGRAVEQDTKPRGSVRIAIGPMMREVAESVAAFGRTYPAIEVDVRVASHFVDLVAEGVDLAIRVGDLDDSTLLARKICDVETVLIAATSYLRQRRRPKTIEDLAGHEWVLFRARNHRQLVRLKSSDGDCSVEAKGSLNTDDMDFYVHACFAGAGIGRMSMAFALQAIEDGKAERVLPRWTAELKPVWIVTPPGLVPHRVQLLRDHLIETLPALFNHASVPRRR